MEARRWYIAIDPDGAIRSAAGRPVYVAICAAIDIPIRFIVALCGHAECLSRFLIHLYEALASFAEGEHGRDDGDREAFLVGFQNNLLEVDIDQLGGRSGIFAELIMVPKIQYKLGTSASG